MVTAHAHIGAVMKIAPTAARTHRQGWTEHRRQRVAAHVLLCIYVPHARVSAGDQATEVLDLRHAASRGETKHGDVGGVLSTVPALCISMPGQYGTAWRPAYRRALPTVAWSAVPVWPDTLIWGSLLSLGPRPDARLNG